MSIPQVSHLQFLILNTLLGGERAGHQLREKLIEEGLSNSSAAFYQMMSRLEDAKFIEGRYEQKLTEGRKRRERRYRISDVGTAAVNSVRSFYLRYAPRGQAT